MKAGKHRFAWVPDTRQIHEIMEENKFVSKSKELPILSTVYERLDVKQMIEKKIAISDSGIGIPKEIRDKVFEPFFTTKDVGQGMGLGLSIIYGIIKDFGGEIELISEEGRGTSFKLIFKRINTP